MSAAEEICANCGGRLGRLEPGYIYKSSIICTECDRKLNGSRVEVEKKNRKKQFKLSVASWIVAAIIVAVIVAANAGGDIAAGFRIASPLVCLWFFIRLMMFFRRW